MIPIHYFNEIGEFVEIDPNSSQADAQRQTAIEQYRQSNPQDIWAPSSGPSGSIFQYQYNDGTFSGTDYVNSIYYAYVGRDDDLETANWTGDYNHIYRGYVYWSLSNLPEDDYIVWDNVEANINVINIWNSGFSTVYATLLPFADTEPTEETGWESIGNGTALGTFNADETTGDAFNHTSGPGQSLYTEFVNAVNNNVSGYIGIGFMVNGIPSDGQMIEMSSSDTFDCYYHIDDVDLTLANKNKDNNNIVHNLTSTTLDLYGNGYNYNNVPSGESRSIAPGGQYTVETNNWDWVWNGQSIKQHHWNSNNNHNKIKRTFTLGNWTAETAWFKEIKPITFQSPAQIEIKDPWFVEANESQPNNYHQITNGTRDVFLNQQATQQNPIALEYRLNAEPAYYNGNYTMVFDSWSVTPSNGATFEDTSQQGTNVVFNTAGTEIEAHYRPAVEITGNVSGELLDGVFNDDVYIVGDTYIPDGATIYATAGTQISFAGNSRLTVNGTFYSEGVQSDPIHYFSANNSNGSIHINIKYAHAQFRHCSFNDIHVLSSDVYDGSSNPINGNCEFNRCIFENNGSTALAIASIDNNTSVNNCRFLNSITGIISFAWAKPEIYNCTFMGNEYGITAGFYTEPIIRKSLFENNITGLYSVANSLPILLKGSPQEWLCSWENNVFTGNNIAVKAENESYPYLGEEPYFADVYGWFGWNRFYNNNTEIINNNEFTIYAIGNNWYPPNPPGEVGCSESSPGNIEGDVLWQPTVYGLVGNNVIDWPEIPVAARQAEGQGDIALALALYDDMVLNEMNVSAVYGVARILWLQKDVTGIINKMDQYAQSYPNTDIEEHSLSLMTSYKLYLEGNINLNEALQHIDHIMLNYPNTTLEPKLLYEEAKIEGKLQGNAKMIAGAEKEQLPIKAKAAYTTLAEKYSDTPYGMMASIMMGNQSKETAEIIPTNFALHPAFPNPFNPVTTIKYELPRDSEINLTVYNIMGQEVNSLINTTKQAGVHTVKWNGTNRHNEPVSSGMYLVRITTQNNFQTQKLVLIK